MDISTQDTATQDAAKQNTSPVSGDENNSSAKAPQPPRRKLDLSRLEPPAQLEESSIEEMTIDGICGVY